MFGDVEDKYEQMQTITRLPKETIDTKAVVCNFANDRLFYTNIYGGNRI